MQEYWLYLLRFNRKIEEAEQEHEQKIITLGVLEAHIANCMVGKKENGQPWSYKDFVTLRGEPEVKKEKLTLKKAKQNLGSKFNLN